MCTCEPLFLAELTWNTCIFLQHVRPSTDMAAAPGLFMFIGGGVLVFKATLQSIVAQTIPAQSSTSFCLYSSAALLVGRQLPSHQKRMAFCPVFLAATVLRRGLHGHYAITLCSVTHCHGYANTFLIQRNYTVLDVSVSFHNILGPGCYWVNYPEVQRRVP